MDIGNSRPSREPCLFDLQVNGFAGIDFQQPSLTMRELELACEQMRARGVGGFLFTLITAPLEQTCQQMRKLVEWRRESPIIHEMAVGIHLEGPFISELDGYRGAHPLHAVLDPTPALLSKFLKSAGGLLRLVTLAPERQGGIDVIRELTDMGVSVALGHTDASERDIDLAIKAGACMCTHLGNGAPQVMHRHDNIINRLLARDELIACFIPDGVHIPFPVLRNYVRTKGWHRSIFTTDCMAAAGAPAGIYTLGELELVVGADGLVRQPDRSGFAGSSLTPDGAVQYLCDELGVPLRDAELALGERVRGLLNLPLIQAGV
ncbi:N-acetylglucosamine-6-phosphate deacetylase [Cerasicoccus maritimus]|uniref:N-acetylglucosamine-6-phosphate deacetylase n=1 Tax=Cerasicoccus maritimus TaxID=490089 RepID=UPI002852C2AC|nr:hypothetical protein [Cerasicoccus maritimus]